MREIRFSVVILLFISYFCGCKRQSDGDKIPVANSQRNGGQLPAPKGNIAGRFIIQEVKYDDDSPVVMRLDTFTGEAWVYGLVPVGNGDVTNDKNQYIFGWIPTFESNKLFQQARTLPNE